MRLKHIKKNEINNLVKFKNITLKIISIVNFPKILIIVLKRFNFIKKTNLIEKINNFYSFHILLDMSKYNNFFIINNN